MASVMTFSHFIAGLVRHTGYACLTLAGLFILSEVLVPAFATPYLNPYLLLVIGMLLALVGGKTVSAPRLGRVGLGFLFVLLLLIAVFSQLSFVYVGTRWLAFGASFLVVAFFFASVYPEDL